MTSKLLKTTLLVLLLGSVSNVQADTIASHVKITIMQSVGVDSYFLYTSPMPNPGCSVNNEVYVLETNPAGAGTPDFKTYAPLLLSAFLYNKDVRLNIDCGTSGFPYIKDVTVYY